VEGEGVGEVGGEGVGCVADADAEVDGGGEEGAGGGDVEPGGGEGGGGGGEEGGLTVGDCGVVYEDVFYVVLVGSGGG